ERYADDQTALPAVSNSTRAGETAVAVLEAVQKALAWKPRSEPPITENGLRRGQGVSAMFRAGSYLACVANIAVDMTSGAIKVEKMTIAVDPHFCQSDSVEMAQFGMYAKTTSRNNASSGRRHWDLDRPYRYISEAYGGYHFNALNGINVDAAIFMSICW